MTSVLIIDSGARGQVLFHAYLKSPEVNNVIISKKTDLSSILETAKKHSPDLIDVAQDDALDSGAVDLLQNKGFRVFGPSKNAARIESSKLFSRRFMQRHNISCPDFEPFNSKQRAIDYISYLYSQDPNKLVFIKADGLCKGKGVLKCTTLAEAKANIRKIKTFGDSGRIFLVENGLTGREVEEFSYFAISDGKTYKVFKSAQDNKTVFNFDQGPNTGGMGSNSPALVTSGLEKRIESEFISPVIEGMEKEGNPFVGILYLGGILVDGNIFAIEYNARHGDPEIQVYLSGVGNYFHLVNACLDERLDEVKVEDDSKTRVCVVGASRGYPNDYSQVKGKRIYGLDKAMKIPGVLVFKAGVDVEGEIFYANGGRLFSIVAEGKNILEAKQKAYSAMGYISVEGNNLHYRTDIAWRDVQRVLKS